MRHLVKLRVSRSAGTGRLAQVVTELFEWTLKSQNTLLLFKHYSSRIMDPN